MLCEVITRKEARERGLKRYFNGKPCKHGHFAGRQTSNGSCVECARLRAPEYTRAGRARNYERVIARERDYIARNKELISQRRKANYHKVRDKNTARSRAHYQANKEIYKARAKDRKAKLRNAPGTITASELREIFDTQGGRCAYCRADLRKTQKHLDHIIPLARGGEHNRRNAQYLCAFCNTSKKATDPIDYARKLGRLL